jgi:hypothetical protein
MAREHRPAAARLPVAILTLAMLLAPSAEDPGTCAVCDDIPPFVATRTELLINNPPPPPLPAQGE